MTPAQCLTYTRYLIKETTASSWTDTELYAYMTEAEQEVFNLIMEEDEGYFQTTNETIDYVSGTQEYDMSAFDPVPVKIVLVERTDLDPKKTLHPVRMQDKLQYEPANRTYTTDADYEYYYINGNKIGIVPIPDESETNNLKIYYIGRPADVSSGSSAFTVPDDYGAHQLIALKTAIIAREKFDEPVDDLERKELKLEARLKTGLVSRQTQEAQYVNYQADSGYDS